MKSKKFKLLSALLSLMAVLTVVTAVPVPNDTVLETRDFTQEESCEENSDVSPMCDEDASKILGD